jgi:hypothetical protein
LPGAAEGLLCGCMCAADPVHLVMLSETQNPLLATTAASCCCFSALRVRTWKTDVPLAGGADDRIQESRISNKLQMPDRRGVPCAMARGADVL